MRVSVAVLLTLFCLVAEPAAARRRAVTPGSRCLVGPLVDDAYVPLIATDATHVYYLDEFTYVVSRVPKNGGLAETVVSLGNLAAFITDLAVDDTNVYVSTIPFTEEGALAPGDVYAAPKTGGSLRTLASDINWPLNLATDATHVYWASLGTYDPDADVLASDGKIERVRKDGTGRQTLAQGLSGPFDVLLDGDTVFFSETGDGVDNPSAGIRRVAKTGGTVTPIESSHVALDLTDNGSEIVFYGGTLNPVNIGLFRVAKSGGTVRQIVEDQEITGGPVPVRRLRVLHDRRDLGHEDPGCRRHAAARNRGRSLEPARARGGRLRRLPRHGGRQAGEGAAVTGAGSRVIRLSGCRVAGYHLTTRQPDYLTIPFPSLTSVRAPRRSHRAARPETRPGAKPPECRRPSR